MAIPKHDDEVDDEKKRIQEACLSIPNSFFTTFLAGVHSAVLVWSDEHPTPLIVSQTETKLVNNAVDLLAIDIRNHCQDCNRDVDLCDCESPSDTPESFDTGNTFEPEDDPENECDDPNCVNCRMARVMSKPMEEFTKSDLDLTINAMCGFLSRCVRHEVRWSLSMWLDSATDDYVAHISSSETARIRDAASILRKVADKMEDRTRVIGRKPTKG